MAIVRVMALNEGNMTVRPKPIPGTIAASMLQRAAAMSIQNPVMVFALFPGVTQLDFTGPHQVFSSLPGAEVILASAAGGAIEASGITFAGLRRLAEIPACDLGCVPGGFGGPHKALGRGGFLGGMPRTPPRPRVLPFACT